MTNASVASSVASSDVGSAEERHEQSTGVDCKTYTLVALYICATATLHLSSFNEAMPLNLSHTNSNKHLEVESSKFHKLLILSERISDDWRTHARTGAHTHTAHALYSIYLQSEWTLSRFFQPEHKRKKFRFRVVNVRVHAKTHNLVGELMVVGGGGGVAEAKFYFSCISFLSFALLSFSALARHIKCYDKHDNFGLWSSLM